MISLYRRISTSPPLIFLDEGGHDSNKGGMSHTDRVFGATVGLL